MRRIEELPPNLKPWFTLDKDGAVRCRKCPATFVGTHADDSTLAKHVSTHIGAKLEKKA